MKNSQRTIKFLRGQAGFRTDYRPRLVVMAKAPRMGRVKTRLATGVGQVKALRFFRQSVLRMLDLAHGTCPFDVILALDPLGQTSLPANWPISIPIIAQSGGDLGVRMQTVFEQMPPGPVMIIGTDCPNVSKAHIVRGFAQLRGADCLLAPSVDGGYWMVGQKRSPRVHHFFNNIRWSTPHCFSDTKQQARHLTLAVGETLNDIDEKDDLVQIGSLWQRRIMSVRNN